MHITLTSDLSTLQPASLDAGLVFSGKPSGRLIQGYAAPTSYTPTIDSDYINRLNELRIRTRNEISSICADLMEYAEQRAGISRLLCHEIRPVVFDMLVTVVSEGTDVRFKYANPCYFIRSVANALPNARFVTSPHLSTIR